MTKTINLVISDTQYIKMSLNNIIYDQCLCCLNVDMDYIDTKQDISIPFGHSELSTICYVILRSDLIADVMKGKRKLPNKIDYDPGIELNEFFYDFHAHDKVSSSFWSDYSFFGNSSKGNPPYFNSWLFNDQEENIIFMITPRYPWSRETCESDSLRLSYEEFMKDYKQLVKVVIPKDRIHEWRDQAEMLRKKYDIYID